MNKDKLIDNWVMQINSSEDKKEETESVLKEINSLLKNNKITVQQKEIILKELFQSLSLPPRLNNGQFLLLEQFDNKQYLQMIKDALSFMNNEKENEDIKKLDK